MFVILIKDWTLRNTNYFDQDLRSSSVSTGNQLSMSNKLKPEPKEMEAYDALQLHYSNYITLL